MSTSAFAQLPEPGPVKSVNIPAVQEKKLKNGLTVAVIEKRGVPIVSAQLLVRTGASAEPAAKAGLANFTGSLLTKGTKTRSADQIAEEMEFLGGSISSGAGWNASSVTMSVTSDKLDQAVALMADVALNPSFKQEEIDLLRSQTLDELKYNLNQPGSLATYVASRYSFNEHPAGGTPASLETITRQDIQSFYSNSFDPSRSVLIVTGDITLAKAVALGEQYFGKWKGSENANVEMKKATLSSSRDTSIVKRMVVVDLPNAGQASVNYFRPIRSVGRSNKDYYAAAVLNSLLGGGYSSRLNQEIRIKRGLSYGAGSSFTWRSSKVNFGTRTQTKNESAAEVAELVIAELKRLAETSATEVELNPRRLVLTGGFGRNLETTAGLTSALSELYSFGIPTAELNRYMTNVNTVNPTVVKGFAESYLNGGDIIIVGDYAKFKDDLAKRFPNMKIEVVKADELNIDSPTLRKSDLP
ncbi:MAG TPA: pitrilysin family protein [Pyrinomonadaceae bacterium]|nr:pitrilysin family protein [Pyrinomonadaceae bacterium]